MMHFVLEIALAILGAFLKVGSLAFGVFFLAWLFKENPTCGGHIVKRWNRDRL